MARESIRLVVQSLGVSGRCLLPRTRPASKHCADSLGPHDAPEVRVRLKIPQPFVRDTRHSNGYTGPVGYDSMRILHLFMVLALGKPILTLNVQQPLPVNSPRSRPSQTEPRTTPPPILSVASYDKHANASSFLVDQNAVLHPRDTITSSVTCGYENGDPSEPRTANAGYDCRVDVTLGLWGFCPTTVILASDCGLAGVCQDNYSCTDGCGNLAGVFGITTFTCSESSFAYCSTVILDSGPDQTYSYIACGRTATIDTLLANPTTETSTENSDSSTTSSSSISNTPTSSTDSNLGSEGSAAEAQTSSSSAASSTTAQATSSTSSTKNTGAIIGGVIGGLALVCITVLAVFYLFRRGSNQKTQSLDLAEDRDNYQHDRTQIEGVATPEGPGYNMQQNNTHLYPAELDGVAEFGFNDIAATHAY
ncbi:hypothetical protein BX600DRAFT_523389 [Xylariales sp. PMI_506]|nr:hypothetical protein BX600DRAFT_523389 [Xylariales sp. PMI_506]